MTLHYTGVPLILIEKYRALAFVNEIPPKNKRALVIKTLRYLFAFYLSVGVLVAIYFWHQQFAQKDDFSQNITMTAYTIHLGPIVLCCAELAATWRARAFLINRLLSALEDLRVARTESPEDILRNIQIEYSGAMETGEHETDTSRSFPGTIHKQNNVDGDGAEDSSTLPKIHISPASPFPEDVKLMREHLHRKQAVPKLENQVHRQQSDAMSSHTGEVPYIVPTSDSEWTLLTSSKGNGAMTLIKDSYGDKDRR